jgi:hypothetical protein
MTFSIRTKTATVSITTFSLRIKSTTLSIRLISTTVCFTTKSITIKTMALSLMNNIQHKNKKHDTQHYIQHNNKETVLSITALSITIKTSH